MITNEMNLPRPFVDAVKGGYGYTPKRYSVTSLLKGTREAILQRRHQAEIREDASDRVWAILGTAVHRVLQDSEAGDGQLKEVKLEAKVGEYTLSGIFDLYDPETGLVTDYKVASVWKAIYADYSDWRMQLLLYAWLLRENGHDPKGGEIVAILRDHSKTKAEFGQHPPHPVMVKRFDFTPGDIDGAGEWLRKRFAEISQAEDMPDGLLPLCTKEERWHRGECWAVKKKGAKKAYRLFKYEDWGLRGMTEAELCADALGYEVEHRLGQDVKCEGYCPAREFCVHYKALKEGSINGWD